MKKALLTTAFGAAVLFATPALAGGGASAPSAGNLNTELLVSNCVVCHGQGGDSQGNTPSINKLNKFQMVNALMEFKAGTRKGTIMTRIAPGYTDAQIEAISNELAGN